MGRMCDVGRTGQALSQQQPAEECVCSRAAERESRPGSSVSMTSKVFCECIIIISESDQAFGGMKMD